MPLKVTLADKSVAKNVLVTKIVLGAKNVPGAKNKRLTTTLLKRLRNLKADAPKANFVLNANTVQPAMIAVHADLALKANVVNLVMNSVANHAANVVNLATSNRVANAAKVVPNARASKSSPSSFLSKSLQAFGQVSPAFLLHSGASLSALSLFLNSAKETVLVVMEIAKMVAVTDVAMAIVAAGDHVAPAVAALAAVDLAPTKAN